MAIELNPTQLSALEARLLNLGGDVNLHERFRALFTLKALGDERAIAAIAKG